jgi:predicted secreted Zn-dependent protease
MRRFLTFGGLALSAYFAAKSWMPPTPPRIHEVQRGEASLAAASPGPVPPLGSPVVVWSAPVVVEERTEYYEVTGSSEMELYQSMRARGPKGAEGVPPGVSSDATTTWGVKWKADYSSEPGRCAIKSLNTSVQILMVMPKWSRRIPGSPLAEQWDRRMQEISAHERVHAGNGIRAANAVRDRVAVLEPAPTCPELTRSIDSTYRSLIEEYRKADRDHDWWAPRIAFKTETGFKTRTEDRGASIAIPLRVPSPAVDPELTDTERQRLAGMAELEAEMAELSDTADRAGAAWRRYVSACPREIRTVAAGASGGREWFGYAWPGSRSTGQTRECAEAQEFYALADEVKDGICRADERARRAFVHPGTRRDLQSKFRLYWGGWDRACR